ncbi:peroxiredoxin [Glycomyces sp. TRM65418]|uniref:peroxiredoxin n=1 Tax=Glycomyces sp. TRM65418 TaxID=2867006 RepID=UPI001CE4D0B7|nr:peroxiredoxin [Glycomyces sp. TRM65418]MCC3763769.1 peroxiredoxin [Glycomyces sp. TRM65418]QZD53480.1 peroxiredoxin [Glycomyces sp. TRM65418]
MDTGDTAPAFTLHDETGRPRSLDGLLESGPVVLFFYPLAMSAGCTAEACHFRDLAAEFQVLGATPVGISRDTVDRQAAFAAEHSLGYPLLSDPDGAVAEAFGARRRLGIVSTKRKTFVIGEGREVLGAIKSELNMNAHADKALDLLRARAGA